MSPRRSSPLALEFILLGFLSRRPMHGYDLHRALREEPGLAEIWKVKQSLLYAMLDKLEGAGYVTSAQVTDESIIPRREFEITPEGRQALQLWASLPVEHQYELRQEFLGKLFFARLAGRQNALALLQAQRANALGWHKRLCSELEGETANSNHALVLRFRQHQVEAALTWLEETEKDLAEPT